MKNSNIRSFPRLAVARALKCTMHFLATCVQRSIRLAMDRRCESSVKPPPRFDLWRLDQALLLSLILLGLQSAAMAVLGSEPSFKVTVRVRPQQEMTGPPSPSHSDVVVWLAPVPARGARSPDAERLVYCIAQRNKLFEPHLLVVPVGSTVEFCNRDRWMHEPFAFSNGHLLHPVVGTSDGRKRLEFNHTGVTYLFCAIHPQMAAVILAVDSPYFGIANKGDRLTISHVPAGIYSVHVWYEHEATWVGRRLVVLPGQNFQPKLSIVRAKRIKAADKTGPESQSRTVDGTVTMLLQAGTLRII